MRFKRLLTDFSLVDFSVLLSRFSIQIVRVISTFVYDPGALFKKFSDQFRRQSCSNHRSQIDSYSLNTDQLAKPAVNDFSALSCSKLLQKLLRRTTKCLLSILPLCLLCACGKPSSHESDLKKWMSANGKLKVLSTTGMIDDLVAEVGKERIDHIALIIGEIDPHSYELVKGDDEKLKFAQVIFSNGLGLEHGASLQTQLTKHPHLIAIGDAIKERVGDRLLTLDGHLDPHVWMDISLWTEGVDAIVEALAKEDPTFADYYRKNGAELKDKMLEKHDQVRALLLTVPSEKRYLVTSHNAFNYFARAYLAEGGNDQEPRCAAPEGLAPDGQLSVVDIQRIIDHLCHYHICVVFPESNVSKDSLKKIVSCCLEKGVKVHISSEVLYGDSMGDKAKNYLDMIWYDAQVMKKEWENEQCSN